MVLDAFWVRMYFSYTADVYMYKKKISFFHQLQNVWTFSGLYLLHTASILKILSQLILQFYNRGTGGTMAFY